MHLPEQSTYEQPPAGTHAAVCCAIIDLGTQAGEYQGEPTMKHQVMVRWELSDELMEDGRPFTIGQFYTWSMSDKAKLRQHLEAWRGKPFEQSDFGPNGFNIRKLIGVPCTLGVIHNDKGNARVSGVSPKMKSVDAKPLINEPIYVALTAEDFELTQFERLSEKLREMIRKSPEHQKLVNGGEDIPTDEYAGFEEDRSVPF